MSTYDATTGQPKTLTRGTQALEWTFDGFLQREEKATGVAPATTQWTYDSDFRVTGHTVGGTTIPFAYDADSLLTQAGAATLTYSATTWTWNGFGELATVSTAVSGSPVFSEGIQYDGAGRITVIEETAQGTPAQWAYGNDAMGRLTSASKNGATASTWTYDGNGNRLTESGVASTFDAQDRLLTRGTTTYTWDALGGRRSKTEGSAVTEYTHDGLGALTSVKLPNGTTISYDYDGRQRRVARRKNSVVDKRWIYDGQYRVVAEVDASGAVQSRFVYGSQSHSPDYFVRGGVTYVYVKNHLGSVRLVVNASTGAVVQSLEYDAWGNVTSDSSPSFQPFAFAGGVHDVDTGLTHFGFRDYDAQAGVWTSRDPIRLSGGRNVLAYVSNSPTRFTDASGLRGLHDNPTAGEWRIAIDWAHEAALATQHVLEFFVGAGSNVVFYGPDSPETKFMRKSPSVQTALQQYRAGGDVKGLDCQTFGEMMLNPMSKYVGRYTPRIRPDPDDPTMLIVTLFNNTSTTSLGHDTLGGWEGDQEWREVVWSGPLGSIKQNYMWTEPR
ncbi:MAG: RHS repeat-associated core domain-containing protein [Archangium sp.]